VPVDSRWPVVLELPSETVRLTGRVVTCKPTDTANPDGPARYTVALAFVEPRGRALRALERTCRSASSLRPDGH
jgi:hypothetical protein